MLRVVIPFWNGDADAAIKCLEWALELNPEGTQHNCLLHYEEDTNPQKLDRVRVLIKQYFKKDKLENIYTHPPIKGWPAAPNWVWQSAARFIDDKGVNEPWFWWESDAIPLKPGWLDAIYNGYLSGGKRFAGHVVDRMDHMNGVGIYPPDVRRRSQDAMMARAGAWDYVLKPVTEYDCTNLNHIIQHVWNIRESDGEIHNGDGHAVTFPDWKHVERYMDFNCYLLHRTKDGTLIERLREHREKEKNRIEEETRISNSTEHNVPDHTGGGAIEISTIEEVIDYKAEILIVTYGMPTKRASGLIVSDFDWLTWCMRGIRKHAKGFSGITLAIPGRDSELLKPISKEHAGAKSGIKFRVRLFDEPSGKGFLMHESIMAKADELVPASTDFVLHLDPDCIFKEPVTPAEYFINKKPVYVYRTYKSLSEIVNGQKVVSDCAQWQAPTENQLGFSVSEYTMCRHPTGFPIEFYKNYREHIESVHKIPFIDYMLSGKNSHPSDRMDFTAMGAYAFNKMNDKFHWIDISGGNHLAPKDRQRCFWSHGGITSAIASEIKSYVS